MGPPRQVGPSEEDRGVTRTGQELARGPILLPSPIDVLATLFCVFERGTVSGSEPLHHFSRFPILPKVLLFFLYVAYPRFKIPLLPGPVIFLVLAAGCGLSHCHPPPPQGPHRSRLSPVFFFPSLLFTPVPHAQPPTPPSAHEL